MSSRSRSLPRRSSLSTPGSSDRFIEKAPSVPADLSFIDLEDSVAPSEKVVARGRAGRAIRELSWDDRVLCVRVNGWHTPWGADDIRSVVMSAGPRLDEIMIPKVESASDVVAIATLLDEIEVTAGLPAGHIGLEILIESAKGLLHLNEICGASNRIESIILGPGDMAASLGLPLTTIDASLHENAAMSPFGYIFAKLLVAGRAHGLHVIDGPLFSVKDLDGLKRSARVTADFGFDGKWALTPDQVAVINEVFSPNDDVVAQSRRLLEAYENATSNEAVGAVLFDGAMIDEASASLARSVLARAQRAAKH